MDGSRGGVLGWVGQNHLMRTCTNEALVGILHTFNGFLVTLQLYAVEQRSENRKKKKREINDLDITDKKSKVQIGLWCVQRP